MEGVGEGLAGSAELLEPCLALLGCTSGTCFTAQCQRLCAGKCTGAHTAALAVLARTLALPVAHNLAICCALLLLWGAGRGLRANKRCERACGFRFFDFFSSRPSTLLRARNALGLPALTRFFRFSR